MLNSKVFNVLN